MATVDVGAVKAALARVGAERLRPVARSLGVEVSFYLPGKGPRYLKTETIYQRIAERVNKGLLTLDAVKAAGAAGDVPPRPSDSDVTETKSTEGEKPMAPKPAYGENQPGAFVKTDTEQELPFDTAGGAEPNGDGAEQGAEKDADKDGDGQQDKEQEGEAKGKPKPKKGKGKAEGAEGDEHPLLKAMREFIHANAEQKGNATAEQVQHVVKIADEIKGKVNGLVHEAFEDVLARAVAGIPTLMVGPAGSGKTHLAGSVAKALGREFVFDSFSPGVGEGKLEGRLLPIGEGGKFAYVSSKFVDAYEKGWCYLADEMDNADPSTISILNAALANGHMSVPSRTEKRVAERHPDFVFMAAANTYGNGADRVYVGRNQLDGATLDRLRIGTVDIKYDKKLEATIEVKLPGGKNVGPVPKSILDWGWAMRDLIAKHKLRRICSMRNMLDAAKLEAVGATSKGWRKSFFADWSTDDLAKIPAELK